MLGARPVDDRWRISSWSISGDCVEVADIGTEVSIRDSKDRGGKMLSFSPTAWSSFIEQSKRTKLD
jgi:hypothetical protein